MEKDLFHDGRLYRTLFEKSPEGLAFCDPSKIIVMVNDEFCKLFGCRREEALGRLLDEVVLKDGSFQEEARKLSEEYRRSGFLKAESYRQKKDGTSFPVSIVATPVITGDAHGGSLWIYRDITEIRRREEELKTREAKLSGILESHPELILRFTPELITTYANRAYCEYHGISIGEAVGESFAEHVSHEYIPVVHSKLLSLTPDNPVITGEEQVVMSSGEIRWQEWTDQGIFDEKGHLVEIQSVGRDITDRKNMEEALSFERESLTSLFVNANEGIVLCHNDGTIVRVNPTFCRMFGFSAEEASGKNIDELLAPDTDTLQEARAYTASTAAGESAASETVRRRKDGSLIEVSFLGVPIMSGAGAGFSYGIYRDISERKRAEESIRASEAKYRNLFETMPNGFYTSTPEGYFIDANPAFISMLGYDSLEELRSVFIPTDLYVREEERVQLTNEKDLNADFTNQFETYRLRRKDGQIIWVEDNARYIRNPDGTVLNQGICRDITDRRRAEEKLHRLNRELFISATTDRVTGLLSRQHFEENLHREIAKASRYKTPLSLVMIDLDNFKKLNDTCGHIAGDSALAVVASAISDRTRASDLVARWGGDEFAIASPTPLENTVCLAQKIRKFLEDIEHGEFGPITGSFGVTLYSKGDSIESLTSRADDLMYQVKRKGGNGVMSA